MQEKQNNVIIYVNANDIDLEGKSKAVIVNATI